MHWLLRLALLLSTALTVVIGGQTAINTESQHPSGADGQLFVTDATEAGINGLKAAGEAHQVQLTKVTHASQNGTPHRVLAVLNPETELPEGVRGPIPGQDYEEYGFFTTTEVQRIDDPQASPLGNWALHGDPHDVIALVDEVQNAGFSLWSSRSGPVTAQTIAETFFSDPLWILLIASLVGVFVAALVSSSTASRIRAVRSLHGRSLLATILAESAHPLGFGVLAAAAGWLTWGLIGIISWGGSQAFGLPGLVFATILVTVTVLAAAATTLATTIVVAAVPRVLDQIKGRRPLGIIFTTSAAALLVTLVAAFVALGFTESSIRQTQTARETAEHAQRGPDGYQISLWGTDENAVRDVLPGWRSFIDEADQQGDLYTSVLSPPGRCVLVATDRPCLALNPAAAQHMGIYPAGSPDDEVSLLIPESHQDQAAALMNSLRERLELESWLDDRDGITASSPAGSIQATVLPAGTTVDVHATGDTTLAPGPVQDPVVVIAPAGAISADTHYSWATGGGAIFTLDRAELAETMERHEADQTVSWLERPVDAAQAQLIGAQQRTVQHAITLIITVSAAMGIAVLLSIVYVERRRHPLFVQHIHGAPLWQRYGSHIVLTAALGVAAVALFPAVTGTGWALRGLVLALALLACGITLHVRDRTLRADTIKHP